MTMTPEQYWETVSAAFTGTGAFVMLAIALAFVLRWVRERFERKVQPEPAEPVEKLDLPEPRRIPFHDERDARSDEGPKGASLFEPSYEDAEREAAQAYVERTQPVQPVRAVQVQEANEVVLCGPPMVDGETLFSYLKHHAPARTHATTWDSDGLGVWASLVEDFYDAAGRDQRISHHFAGVEMNGLRRHFTRALVDLCHRGLTLAGAEQMREVHAHLGITAEEFDATTSHLVHALQAYLLPHVFEHVLPQLVPAVTALRNRLVVSTVVS